MKLKERKLYIVKKGDTLASIAADHATTQRKLRVMNKKDRHWQPKVGDKIHIPNKEFIEKNLLDQLKETFVDVFKIKLGTHFGQKAKSTKSKKTL